MRRRAGPTGRARQRIARSLGEMRALRAAIGRRSDGAVGRTLRRRLLDRLAIGAILIRLVEHAIAIRALVLLRRLLLWLLLFLLLRNANRRHADSAWRTRRRTAHAVVVCGALRAAIRGRADRPVRRAGLLRHLDRAALALLELGPGRAAIGRRADWAVSRASLRRRLDRAAFALLELGAGRAAIGRRADRPISWTGLRRRHDGAALALLELGSGRAAIGRRADRAISRTRVLACFGLVRAAGSLLAIWIGARRPGRALLRRRAAPAVPTRAGRASAAAFLGQLHAAGAGGLEIDLMAELVGGGPPRRSRTRGSP